MARPKPARPLPGPAWKHGDERNRTADLLVANQSLSQLSYVPAGSVIRTDCGFPQRLCPVLPGTSATVHPLDYPLRCFRQRMGLVGVGPTTSPLSGARSNQLSYKPVARGSRSAGRPHGAQASAARHQLSCKPQENKTRETQKLLPAGRPCGGPPNCGSYRFSNVPRGTRRGP